MYRTLLNVIGSLFIKAITEQKGLITSRSLVKTWLIFRKIHLLNTLFQLWYKIYIFMHIKFTHTEKKGRFHFKLSVTMMVDGERGGAFRRAAYPRSISAEGWRRIWNCSTDCSSQVPDSTRASWTGTATRISGPSCFLLRGGEAGTIGVLLAHLLDGIGIVLD